MQACSSKSCGACRSLLAARGDAAFRVAIRFASAPTIRCCAAVGGSAALRMRHTPCGCRSAYLVEVRSNHRLPEHSSMRRAKQCRYFASSLPPSKRHSRLTTVRRGCCQVATRRDSWRSHVHRTHTAQRVQPFKLQTANAGGRGALPSPFSGGFKGGILFGKRIPPLVSRRARRSPSRAYAGKGAALSGYPSLRAARGKHLRPCGHKKRAPLCSPLTGVTSNSWDTPAGHRIYDACRGSSVSWVCRGSGASIVSSTSC